MEGLDRVTLRGRAPAAVAIAVAATAAAALGLMLWLQFHRGLLPCSLCIYQRLAIVLLIVLVLLGLWGSAPWRRASWSGAVLASLAGAGLAGWQWHLAAAAASRVRACTAVQLLPESSFAPGTLAGSLAAALAGKGSCAVAGQARWLGWPITHWSLLFFLLSALLIAWALWSRSRTLAGKTSGNGAQWRQLR
ncbi:MAG: disulfide bond formation protein B [Acidithiobacillus sp.]|uniref:disulfide bond formation protein B n=1 Tax=Acidithiobacillus sp. TaxID=1872118 RepID=UPI0025C08C38|nr:disulfide bond formation protein B [Acidithiobacillus sp.]